MLGNKPIYGLDSHLKPTCQASGTMSLHTSGNDTLNQYRWCSGTHQSTAWIATWNQPARLPHIPCRPCKALGTSQTNLLCSRKNQQHEPSHQWTCCSPQKRIVCVPPCIKSRQHPKHFPTSPLGQYCAGSLLLNFGGQKRSSAFRRIWPSAALGKLLKLTNQAICISRCRNRCSFAL